MENFLKRITVLFCLLSLSLASAPLHSQSTLTEASQISIALPDMNEATFYKLVDEEAQKVLEKLAPSLLKEEAEGLAKIKEKVIKVLKSLNFWAHAKHLFIQHGIGVAITSAVSEVVTVLVLPPVFIGMGWSLAAVVVGGTPSPLYMVPAYLAIAKLRDKHKLAGEMGYSLSHLMKLDRLRRDLLGYAIENRVMDVMMDEINGDETITIIKRKFSRFKSGLDGNLVEFSDLETIVKDGIGSHKLSLLKEYSHGDDAVYANLMVQEINRDAKMKLEFHELVHSRINNVEPGLDRAKHAKFYKLHDELEVIKRYRSKMREFKGSTNRLLKDNGIDSKANKQIIADFSENMLADLDHVDHELKVFEYRYLNSIREGLGFSNERFESEIEAISKRLQATQWNIDSKVMLFEESSELQSLIERLGKFNDRFRFASTMTSNDSCHGIMFKLVQREF